MLKKAENFICIVIAIFMTFVFYSVRVIAQDGMYVQNEIFDKDYFRVQPDFYALNEDGIPIWYKVNFKAYEYVSYRKEYDEVIYQPFYNINPTNAEFEKTDEVIVMYDYESVHREKKNYSGYKRIVIPSEVKYNGKVYKVTKIGDSAFRGSDVEEVILPNSVNTLFMGAFYHCSNLKKVKMPDEVNFLGEGLFSRCISLEKIKMSSLTYDGLNVKRNLFRKCKNLKEIIIDKTWKTSHIAMFDIDYVYNDSYATFEQCLNSYWFKITIRE